MIDRDTAGRLLDFGARIGRGQRADEQLEGAVALHNILSTHRVAYLADEVGMGKTYVALGAVALFRHFQPDFRLLVIAPRENIQRKWIKELTNFAAHNVRFPDLRFTAVDRRPARPVIACDNLIHFVREAAIDSSRDFFLRLSSFSLPLGERDREGWRRLRDELRSALPWIPDDVLDLRSVTKQGFKDDFARAVCCAIPRFDLVIVDEGHNLKHGFGASSAARNRVLGLAFGHPSQAESARRFPHYGPRAERVLFLSATPLEESYQHVYNQLDVFGLGDPFASLCRDDLSEEEKKKVASQFLVRRVTTMRVAGEEMTKNQYRREWRRGGVHLHDEPIRVEDDRERLVVALVQKKVAELLGSEKFNRSFQIGMLASFESFLETTKLKRAEGDGEAVFDDTEQTDDSDERDGIDVRDINRLTRDYYRRFGSEMPHPKMDAVVRSLADAWTTGRKALVFVRRVASVKDLKKKLDERYDEWIIGSLKSRLPASARASFDEVVQQYEAEKREAEGSRQAKMTAEANEIDDQREAVLEDRGGKDTFFAWFFRGEGPLGVVSGARVQRRFIEAGAAYATFFEDNHVMALLGARPGGVLESLAAALGRTRESAKSELQRRAARYLSARAKEHVGADRMEAAQAAALDLLAERTGEIGESARTLWRERYETSVKRPHARVAPDVSDWLEQPTFFTELRRPERAALRARLWPIPGGRTVREQFRESELRGQLLSTAARLGHSLIDLYVLTIQRTGSLKPRALELDSREVGGDLRRIEAYLDLLDEQRRTEKTARAWGAFDELAEIAASFDTILDVNAPDARTLPLVETARYFGSLLRQQQPIGGMFGQVNRTLVQQFRMPGYPFVLVTTDLLQEGEDLHTFCSSVHHYGISWTPSSMEQRIGRIDRVRSQTDRRLSGRQAAPSGEELLQVYFPHLEDTVEVLQVQRVLERMNVFLRLMHEGLTISTGESRRVDVAKELTGGRRAVEAIRERLRSAFPIPEWAMEGRRKALAVDETVAESALQRFQALAKTTFPGLEIDWEPSSHDWTLLGTVKLPGDRIQPFALLLGSLDGRLLVRCISPIGRVGLENAVNGISESAAATPARIGAILSRDEGSYDLTAEGDVLLANGEHDAVRVSLLLRRVTEQADRLERIHLPALDQRLDVFADDLRKEGGNGHD